MKQLSVFISVTISIHMNNRVGSGKKDFIDIGGKKKASRRFGAAIGHHQGHDGSTYPG